MRRRGGADADVDAEARTLRRGRGGADAEARTRRRENCFKGGVGCQTCGVIRNNSLWVGAVTDSGCNEGAGYLAD